MPLDCNEEFHCIVDTFEGDGTDDALVEKAAGGSIGGRPGDEILVFIVKVLKTIVSLAPGQDMKASCRLWHLLHLSTFEVEVVQKVLSSTSNSGTSPRRYLSPRSKRMGSNK